MNATYGTFQTFINVTEIAAGAFMVEDFIKIPQSISFNELFSDVAPNESKNLIISTQNFTISLPEDRNADYIIRIGYAGSFKYWQLSLQTKIVDIDTQKTHFLTYGNERFAKSVLRICNEAKESNFFDYLIDGSTLLDNEFKTKFSNVLQRSRGGGYWIWKPHIINEALQKIADDDILVYCDAGCTINKNGSKKWVQLKKVVNGSKFGIVGFQLTHREQKYTNEKVFEHFSIAESDLSIRDSPQFMASIIIIRKCAYSQMLIDEWVKTLHTDVKLFTDDYNSQTKTNQFIDHRHDQSVFSVLRKIRGCAVLPDDTFAHDWSTITDVPFQTTRIRE